MINQKQLKTKQKQKQHTNNREQLCMGGGACPIVAQDCGWVLFCCVEGFCLYVIGLYWLFFNSVCVSIGV